MRPGLRFICAVCIISASWIGTAAPAADLHRLWEDRCADCHGEAGDFARKFLAVTDEELRGGHANRDLRLFLQNHYLKNNEIDAVYAMLQAQAGSGPRFKEKCTPCHEKAAGLVRESLIRRNGVLYGRTSGQAISEFMQGHGSLQAGEVGFFVELMYRVDREVRRP